MNSIFKITEDMRYLNALLEESGGEITPEIERALSFTQEALVAKVEDLSQLVKYSEALAAMAGTRIAELQEIKRRAERKVNTVKEAIAKAMEVYGLDRLSAGLYTISFRKSLAVEIENEAKIPNEFIKVETHINKKDLRAYLAHGGEVEGAHLVERRNLQLK